MNLDRPTAASPCRLHRLLGALVLSVATGVALPARAGDDAQQALEQAMATAQQDQRGVTLFVAGQAISGAVTRIEPGRWVELRSAQHGRIVVRLDRVDGIARP